MTERLADIEASTAEHELFVTAVAVGGLLHARGRLDKAPEAAVLLTEAQSQQKVIDSAEVMGALALNESETPHALKIHGRKVKFLRHAYPELDVEALDRDEVASYFIALPYVVERFIDRFDQVKKNGLETDLRRLGRWFEGAKVEEIRKEEHVVREAITNGRKKFAKLVGAKIGFDEIMAAAATYGLAREHKQQHQS